jgi:UDP-galactopyranose mutase
MSRKRILVVGAGFAGATYARTLAAAGHLVQVIDKRAHVAGNAFDFVDVNGVRVHRYGPHLFHTNNEKVVDWLQRWGEWVPYEHRVRAQLPNGSTAPLPINRRTLEMVFDVTLPDAYGAEEFLSRLVEPRPRIDNAADYLMSKIGRDLTDLFFRPYTKKMWELDLEDLDPSVVQRIPLRFDDEDRYFPNDRYQMLPKYGYTTIFETLLNHPNIEVTLQQPFAKGLEVDFDMCFLSIPIDEYYGYCFGELPYRSIRFDHHTRKKVRAMGWACTNFTDDGPCTRETAWHALPLHDGDGELGTYTRETPCDYRDNEFERYYPVRTSDGRFQAAYEKYRELTAGNGQLQFIGRCGTYQYLDMHQVINSSLQGAERWLRAQS